MSVRRKKERNPENYSQFGRNSFVSSVLREISGET